MKALTQREIEESARALIEERLPDIPKKIREHLTLKFTEYVKAIMQENELLREVRAKDS